MIYFELLDLSLGQLGILWQGEDEPQLLRIMLPESCKPMSELILTTFPDAKPHRSERLGGIRQKLERYDRGETVTFTFPEQEITSWGNFTRLVWQATSNIPYGEVSTYGTIAEIISAPGAARAVGTALGKNPFPLIIPCHRVLRNDRTMGGFSGGGIGMKRILLEREGLHFDQGGRLSLKSFRSSAPRSSQFNR